MEERDKVRKQQQEQRSAASEAYRKKLQDVRWQKMRLQVFERDKWQCQACFAGEGNSEGTSLQAHHTYYRRDADPWDYPLDSIVTLCSGCHDEETHTRSQVEQEFLRVLRERGLLTGDLKWLTLTFKQATFIDNASMQVFNLGWILDHPHLQKLVSDLVKEKM